ncbi:hypothetical protein [Marilutibacter spongiae]|uniref:DUF3619 family protein n=1 Tax=Marilutibacter spongiae TaxID=2025720 RepID=A0A7W3TKH3_9GAMM|nr:hypothetical protein [Lysobacter spongiae]MBB1059599.1 hypothetical protein [Lysobacter spongiae]
MNAPHDTPPADARSGADFDQAMRALHAEGLARLKPRTLSRLRRDRHEVFLPRPHARPGWMMGGALAAVFACALGIAWLQSPPSSTTPAPALSASTDGVAPTGDAGLVSALEAAEDEVVLNPLDEDPDLYLWLAANDEALPAILER